MKLLLILVLLLLGLGTTQAQITAIPDTAFEQRLIQLGIDSDGQINGQVLTADVLAVNRLSVDSSNISDLTGIEAFINLDTLECYYNTLDSLDLSTINGLKLLSCQENQLSYVKLATANPNLKTINCQLNQLTNLDVSTAPALEWLNCYENQLSTLDLQNCPSFKVLLCYVNNLSELDLTDNPLLEELYCGGNQIDSLDLTNNPNLIIFYCQDNGLESVELAPATRLRWTSLSHNKLSKFEINLTNTAQFRIIENNPDLRVCINDSTFLLPNFRKDPSAVYLEECYEKRVEGQVFFDMNNNCLIDSTDIGARNVSVCFANNNSTICFLSYDSLGTYTAYLDTGWYTVTVDIGTNYWQTCLPSQQIYVDTSGNVQQLNWVLDPVVNCPHVVVDLGTPFLRAAGGGSPYTISYCNQGTLPSANSLVEVILDPFLNLQNTSLPIVSQTGNTYTFNVGTVGVGQCGSFTMQVTVDTSALIGQTHCTEVRMFPDSICAPNTWTGAILRGDVRCQNDTVFFFIKNVGTAMGQAERFIVIEDDIAMRSGFIQLGAGQDTVIIQPAAAGSTYRIEVVQELGFPPLLGDSILSLAREGCNPYPDGTFKTGFITQFSNGSISPYIAINCQPNIASYDPNDKQAQPEGYGPRHLIHKNIPIDYRIRFQNTGTDTAFNILIVDTLSPYLDVSTLQMGASSHTYSWSIRNGNILEVFFADILLVDSNTNEPLSNGFFRYKINQVANNPLGTIIENQAAIYFDFNPPIFTNTTFHEIGENFVPFLVVIDKIYKEKLNVLAYPNPFKNQVTFELEGSPQEQLQLSITDAWGRVIDQVQVQHSQQIHWQAPDLVPGIYFFQISNEVGILSTGKLIAD